MFQDKKPELEEIDVVYRDDDRKLVQVLGRKKGFFANKLFHYVLTDNGETYRFNDDGRTYELKSYSNRWEYNPKLDWAATLTFFIGVGMPLNSWYRSKSGELHIEHTDMYNLLTEMWKRKNNHKYKDEN